MAEYVDEELDREVDELLAPVLGMMDRMTERIRKEGEEMAKVSERTFRELKASMPVTEKAHQLWVEYDQKEKDAARRAGEREAAKPSPAAPSTAQDSVTEDGSADKRDLGERKAAQPSHTSASETQEGGMKEHEVQRKEEEDEAAVLYRGRGRGKREAAKAARASSPPIRGSGMGRGSVGLEAFVRRYSPAKQLVNSSSVEGSSRRPAPKAEGGEGQRSGGLEAFVRSRSLAEQPVNSSSVEGSGRRHSPKTEGQPREAGESEAREDEGEEEMLI